MSHQSSDMGEPEEAHAGSHKKRKGDYKLWMRYIGDGSSFWMRKWSKVRSYETEEIATKAMKDMDRKWNQTAKGTREERWKFIVSTAYPKD